MHSPRYDDVSTSAAILYLEDFLSAEEGDYLSASNHLNLNYHQNVLVTHPQTHTQTQIEMPISTDTDSRSKTGSMTESDSVVHVTDVIEDKDSITHSFDSIHEHKNEHEHCTHEVVTVIATTTTTAGTESRLAEEELEIESHPPSVDKSNSNPSSSSSSSSNSRSSFYHQHKAINYKVLKNQNNIECEYITEPSDKINKHTNNILKNIDKKYLRMPMTDSSSSQGLKTHKDFSLDSSYRKLLNSIEISGNKLRKSDFFEKQKLHFENSNNRSVDVEDGFSVLTANVCMKRLIFKMTLGEKVLVNKLLSGMFQHNTALCSNHQMESSGWQEK